VGAYCAHNYDRKKVQQVFIRRATRALLAVLAISAVSGCHRGVGDSVFALIASRMPHIEMDASPGRSPEGSLNGATTGYQAVQQAIPEIDPGEWLVMEDDAATAAPTTLEEWADYVAYTVDMLPDDRCLLWVTPFNDSDAHTDAKAQTVRDLVPTQPCSYVLDWHAAVRAQPWFVVDGVHPDQAGQDWLVAGINAVVPQP
jgi:hypothetical protein